MRKLYTDTVLGSSEGTVYQLSYCNYMALRLGFLKEIYSPCDSMTPVPTIHADAISFFCSK